MNNRHYQNIEWMKQQAIIHSILSPIKKKFIPYYQFHIAKHTPNICQGLKLEVPGII